ncbi:MAG: DUF748 domain-containing protein [Deltaproteobacteria bacterium]|nr:DUF748 domain-containing protein [Deltaproteobacteria bacterium]
MAEKTEGRKPGDKKNRSWKRFFLNRWFLIGVGILLVYTLLGFFLAPRLVTNFMTDFGQKTLKRHISVREVRVNPFIFTLEAKDFSLAEEDGRPIARFQRLFVDFELSSLFRWAWTFANIRLEGPALFLEIGADGHLNLAKLADSLPKSKEPPPAEKSPPPRLVIQHAAILEGSFTFSDQSKATPAQETFTPLNLEFKEISTLPERKGPYTIRADLPGGGIIGWKGEVSLRPIFSEGQLSVTGFQLATAWQFAQDELRLKKPAGEVNLNTSYRFDYVENAPQLVLTNGQFELKGLTLTEKPSNQPLVNLETMAISGVGFDLKNQQVAIGEILLSNGKVAAAMNDKGILNWQTLVVPKKVSQEAPPPPAEAAPTAPPWHLKTAAVKIENIAASFVDASRAKPLALSVGGFNLGLAADAAVGSGKPEASLHDLRLKLTDVILASKGADNPLVKLDTLTLDDGTVDVGARSVKLAKVAVNGGESRITRDRQGRLQLTEALAPADPGATPPAPADKKDLAEREGQSWSFYLDSFSVNGFKTLVEDHSFDSPVKYSFQDISAAVNNISNNPEIPIEFDAALKVAQGGDIQLNGQLGSTGDHAEADVKISAFSLTPLQPAVARFSTLALTSGRVSATAKLKYEGKESGPQVRVDGSLRLNRLRINEAATKERAMEWKTLAVDGIRFSLAPNRLRIKRVRLLEPGAKVLISKDRRLNLAEAIKIPESDVKEPPPTKGKKQKMFPVSIGSLRVEKGTVDFSDLSLIFPFSTRITDFKGGISDISSALNSRSSVKFNGRVDQYGLATVEGNLSPFAPKDHTDIQVNFNNIAMQSFTPYSATFAGRKIASGVLNVNLGYKIENSQLSGENGVILERFTLGERVKSPDALSLPLDLAIALLTDSNGVIDLAVPVRGNIDDPEFSYGHIIWKAFFNIITSIVTSPFRALGGLFGGGEEQVDAIAFNPGSPQLLPPEQEKLKKVVQALEKRPQLRLVVLGRFDPESDGLALRTERVKRSLASEMGQELLPEEEPGPVDFNQAKTQRSLEKLLDQRSGKKAVDNFQVDYEKSTGKEVKRVNPALALLGVESKDTAFYQALFDELVKLEPLGEEPLRQLAQKRAEVIAQDLVTGAGLDEQRVAVGDAAAAEKASQKTVATRLQLDVLQPAPGQ